MRLEFRAAIVAGAIAGLLACGGGGDGVTSAAQRGTFDADAVFTKVLGGGAALSGLMATDPAGVQYTASLAYTGLADDSFLGTPARRSVQTATVGPVGGDAAVATTTVFYETGPARLLGTVTSTGKTTVFLHGTDLPTAARIGQSGQLAEGTAYASPALGTPVGTETLSWSVEPDNGATALACLTSVSRSADSVSTEKDCFRIDSAGNISGGTIYIAKPGWALTFQH
jgi:hypothetical protein